MRRNLELLISEAEHLVSDDEEGEDVSDGGSSDAPADDALEEEVDIGHGDEVAVGEKVLAMLHQGGPSYIEESHRVGEEATGVEW